MLPPASATRNSNMHDDTIPAPLMHRDSARQPEPVSSSTLFFKTIAASVVALCLIVLLLR